MNEQMRTVGRKMSIMMGASLSFCLSLIGNLGSGHFTFGGWIISFLVSFLISLLIGFLVPMGKINRAIAEKYHLLPDHIKTRLINALVSDIIYTPIMTFVMTFLAWRNAVSHGASMPFLPMFLSSLLTTFIAGFILILVLEPIFMKQAMKGVRGK